MDKVGRRLTCITSQSGPDSHLRAGTVDRLALGIGKLVAIGGLVGNRFRRYVEASATVYGWRAEKLKSGIYIAALQAYCFTRWQAYR